LAAVLILGRYRGGRAASYAAVWPNLPIAIWYREELTA